MKTYVPRLPNYTNNLRRLGWKDDEFKDGCSDRLVDAIFERCERLRQQLRVKRLLRVEVEIERGRRIA